MRGNDIKVEQIRFNIKDMDKKKAIFVIGNNIIENILLMQRRVALNEIGESEFELNVYLDSVKFNLNELYKQVKDN